MFWLLIIFALFAIYLIASVVAVFWYTLTPTSVPSKWLEFLGYPVGIIMLIVTFITDRRRR